MPVLRLKRKTRYGGVPIVLAAAILVGCEAPPPPNLEWERARRSLHEASFVSAPVYARESYETAARKIEVGRMEMARELGRPGFMRDFTRARSYMELGREIAERAREEALINVETWPRRADSISRVLAVRLVDTRRVVDASLLRAELHRAVTECELLWDQGQNANELGLAAEALRVFELAMFQLDEIDNRLEQYRLQELGDENIGRWRRQFNDLVLWSKANNTVAILVDKIGHRCYVVQRGRIVETYDAELGFQSATDKSHNGDAATPEGRYEVVNIRYEDAAFYKALDLDYPNAVDEARFIRRQLRGEIPMDASLGGGIQIHGEGGRGVDWTDGCVALSNRDMDEILTYARLGTPVVIVRWAKGWR